MNVYFNANIDKKKFILDSVLKVKFIRTDDQMQRYKKRIEKTVMLTCYTKLILKTWVGQIIKFMRNLFRFC